MPEWGEGRVETTSGGDVKSQGGGGGQLRWTTSVLVPALPRLSLTSASVSAALSLHST